MATINGTTGNDFVHKAGDGLVAPAGYNDIPEATDSYDYFYGEAGGNDRVYLGAGYDYFYFDHGFNAADRLDGGADYDYLYVYQPTSIVFNATTIRNIESIRLDGNYPGAYGYTFHDGNIAAGGNLSIDGSVLEASVAMNMNLAAETDAGYVYVYGGAAGDRITGGTESDYFYGYAGDDSLIGGEGTDYLYGGSGIDTLVGGNGNDGYYDFDGDDVIVEETGGGNDYISTDLPDYTLPVNVETLYFQGAQPLNGTGNDQPNSIYGNEGDNRIAGQGGNDYLTGSNGDDSLLGGQGDDSVYGGVGNDTLIGNAGADYMAGESGDDTYVNPDIGYIYEAPNRGIDTVESSTNWTLEALAYVENLTLIGDTATDGRGNESDNVITGNDIANALAGLGGNDRLVGNSGNDTLAGGDGSDTLFGGSGRDVLLGGKGNDAMSGGADPDTFRFALSNSGNDTINGFSAAQDRFDIAGGTFTLATIVGSDTRLSYAGGNILVTGTANDNETFWNGLVLPPGGTARTTQALDGGAFSAPASGPLGLDATMMHGLSHGDYWA